MYVPKAVVYMSVSFIIMFSNIKRLEVTEFHFNVHVPVNEVFMPHNEMMMGCEVAPVRLSTCDSSSLKFNNGDIGVL